MVSQIDRGSRQGQWAFPGLPVAQQPAPTLADVTGNQGIRNLTYADQAAAKQAGNAVYDDNRQQTNASQRAAIANVAPTDLNPGLATNQATLQAGVAQLPPPTSAQDTGATFRSGVQSVYDDRMNTRNAAGSQFDALDNSPAHIDLTPVIDFATQQAASNAGEVGNAYKAALGQFKSGTGITLDTAPFANSVLKGLSDLQSQYPPRSAAGRAVQTVRQEAEKAIFAQGALTKLPFAKINAQFKTLDGAQRAIDGLNVRQAVVEKFETALGTGATDAQGNKIYSPAQFDKAVNQTDWCTPMDRKGPTASIK